MGSPNLFSVMDHTIHIEPGSVVQSDLLVVQSEANPIADPGVMSLDLARAPILLW